MMFETTLSSRMQMALRRLTGKGSLQEDDIETALKEIRRGLLEADVHLSVIKAFTDKVKEEALGIKIIKGLNPSQQVVKVVKDTLMNIMGTEHVGLIYQPVKPSVFMLVGLQGSGKTTTVAKLAGFIKKDLSKKVLLVALDIYRPAAIEQLHILGKSIQAEVFDKGLNDPVKTTKEAIAYAKANGFDVVILDTAGRQSIDLVLMDELKDIKKEAKPNEILLTVDSMTGQDAAVTTKNFNDALGITGAILTKLDGDSRGGAALSITMVSKTPIKFMTSGEDLKSIEAFHPDRIADRILGMGDVMTLVEKATEAVSEDDAKNIMEKIQNNTFNYNDLRSQLKMMKKMGSLKSIASLIPGLGKSLGQVDDKPLKEMEIMMQSMTKDERLDPSLIDKSSKRRERIAKGSGLTVTAVNQMRQSFERQKQMMKQMMHMDPNDISKMKPEAFAPKMKKGKGKNKGRFKY
jgi:signal recognition particle subunit SRP54